MKSAAAYLATLFFSLGVATAESTASEEVNGASPNFIVVFIDDLGWSDFSSFGNREVETPNIDRIAHEGIRFKQFYANAPICSPSRCAITTGQYPQRWSITSYLNNRQDNARRGVANWLNPAAPTLARSLQSHGYATGHFGKWHLGGQRDVADAPEITEYGFDASLTNFEGMGAKLLPLTLKPGDEEPGRIWEDAERLGEPVTWTLRSKITTGFVDRAIEFIDQSQSQGKPFYINLWPDDVHSPFWPSLENWPDIQSESKIGKRSDNKPPQTEKRAKYLAVLRELDTQLGKLFDYVSHDEKLKANTLLIICSDNGPEAGAGSSSPLRASKGALYEGGIRSPLIVWGPGLQAPHKRGAIDDHAIIAAFDLAPSLLAIANLKDVVKTEFDGIDVSRTLLGEDSEPRESPIFWRRPPDRKFIGRNNDNYFPDLAVRSGVWKLTCEYDGSKAALYDLSKDPSEKKDVAQAHPEIVERLKNDVVAWHVAMPADRGPELATRD